MQIPTLSLLSLLSSITLIPSSFGSLRPIHCVTPSSSSDQVTLKTSFSGYKGPGFYTITNLRDSLNIALTDTKAGSPVNLQNPSEDNSQRWLIAAVEIATKTVVIINNATGFFLSATSISGDVQAVAALPYDPSARWTVNSLSLPSTADPQAVFNSVVFPGNALAHRKETPDLNSITISPLATITSPDQFWLLKYLE